MTQRNDRVKNPWRCSVKHRASQTLYRHKPFGGYYRLKKSRLHSQRERALAAYTQEGSIG